MSADELIDRLGLERHPEGGWFRETWRAPAKSRERAASTAILFLLKSSERSHWHRIDADEIWIWQGGDALKLMQAPGESSLVTSTLLGPAEMPDHRLQAIVPARNWQAAEPQPRGAKGYVLVSCVVAPGFEFAGFELAAKGWQPGTPNRS